MYRRSKFIEILLDIRSEMAREADYDVDLFAEMVRADSTTVRVSDRKRLLIERSAKANGVSPAEPAIAIDPVAK